MFDPKYWRQIKNKEDWYNLIKYAKILSIVNLINNIFKWQK